MKQDYILFFDSGIGGISVLAKTAKLFNYNYLYFADNKNCPYGEHSQDEIISYVTEIITNIQIIYKIKIVVIACNTATAAAIDHLRATFKNIIFIGTEPAILYANKLGYNKILTLTTPLTNSLNRYKILLNKSSKTISTYSFSQLAKNIENFYCNQNFQNKLLLLEDVAKVCNIAKSYDCMVLGCTHYVFLKPFISQFSNIKTLDGNEGIANNVIEKINSINIKPTKKLNIKFMLSLKNKTLLKKYKKILRQTLANYNNLC